MKHIKLFEQFVNESTINEGNASINDVIDILKNLHKFSSKIKFRTEDINGFFNIVYDDPRELTSDILKALKNSKFWNTDFAPSTGKFPGGRVNINFSKSTQDILNIKDFDKKDWSPK